METRLLLYLFLTLSVQGYCQRVLNSVEGVVVEQESQMPIEGAIITFIEQNIVVFSKDNGSFLVDSLESGYHTVYVFTLGYEPLLTESFQINRANSSNLLEFKLQKKQVDLEEIVVVAAPFRTTVESPMSSRRIGIKEIDLTPGANRDVSKVAQLSAGVIPISFNNRNDILARGGGADENRYFLDGIEIPLLNHFAVQGGSGGYASLVNSELLSGLQFYTGAFPAEFNNGVSSILDMRMKRGNSDKLHGKVVLGASDLGLTIDTPISKNGKTTLLASYRRSYLQLLFDILELPFLPTYNDYQFKVSSKIDNRRELYFIGLGSFDRNRLNLSLNDTNSDQRYILGYLPNNDQSSNLIGAGYKQRFSGGINTTTISYSNVDNLLYKYRNNEFDQGLTFNADNKDRDYQVRNEVKIYDIKGFNIKAGVGIGYSVFDSEIYNEQYIKDSLEIVSLHNSVDIFSYNLFASVSRSIVDDRLSGSLGFRVDGMNYSKLTSNPLKQFSPRATLVYDIDSKFRAVTSVGRYYQEPNYTSMSIYSNKGRLKYLAVTSYALGGEWTPTVESKLKLEGFYKQYINTPISLVDSLPLSTSDFEASILGAVPIKSCGRGRVYGAELTYRNLNLKNTIVNAAYTFMYAEQNRLDSDLQPIRGEFWRSSWDVRHMLNICGIHTLPRNWSIGAKWYFVSGLPYTPYDESLSSLIVAWDQRQRPYSDNSKYNAKYTESYHQLDVRIDKIWYINNLRMGFYVDIQNIYNKQAARQDRLSPTVNAEGDKVVDPEDPRRYLMRYDNSYIGGTILPTLGITIEL